MSNTKVVAIMWTLVAVTLVLFFAGLVTEHQQFLDGSYVVPPARPHHCVRTAGPWCQ